MVRIVISYIVMLGFIFAQLATMPHAHANCDAPVNHDFRPHVHVSYFGDAGHFHDSRHPHHHDSDGTHSHHATTDKETEQNTHDSDAIYLPPDVGVSLPAKSLPPDASTQALSTIDVTAIPSTIASLDSCALAFFRGSSSPAQPLWLVLRALRL